MKKIFLIYSEALSLRFLQTEYDEQLEERYRDHKLIGDYIGTRECHIEPDWLLIYENTAEKLSLIRTGTHSDLFG